MSKDKGKVKKIQADAGKKILISSDKTENNEIKHPVFCFKYLNKNYDLSKCTEKEKVCLLTRMHRLSQMTWKDIQFADKHGFGTEKINQTSIKTGLPPEMSKDEVFLALRFDGLKPMVGYKNSKSPFVFHIVYLDRDFTLYNH